MTDSVRDLSRSARSLVVTDIIYKIVAFALLSPATALLLRWMMSGSGEGVIADSDILFFFVTTPAGLLTLAGGGAILLGISALEIVCLMAIGFAAAQGGTLDVRGALVFGAARAPRVLALTAHMVVRVLAGLVPFGLASGLVYWALLRGHDINYYLAHRPPVFWAAAGIGAVIVAALAALVVRTIVRWALSLPLVLFENVRPRRALGESARRSAGNAPVVVMVLASWAAVALALLAAATWLPKVIARSFAPHLSGSLAMLMLLVTGLALLWAALVLVAGIVNVSLFALAILRLYLRIGSPREPRGPEAAGAEIPGARLRIRRYLLAGGAVIAALAVVGLALLAAAGARRDRPVMVLAHRGSSARAPENTLAAFRLAAEQGADFVELDVQESADGEVMVVHDSDLMKVGGSPMKIWETSAVELRSVDIGSHAGPQYSGERVPTLAEALAVCKGRCRVNVELKSYGHDQRLEERVASIVEAAGMANDCIFMSLDHDMVRTMKRLRPSWRCGVLAAKAIGDFTSLPADFLAVAVKMATRRFVWQAHRAGREVYVWTVDDPARMLDVMSLGADGLITNKPDLAREVVMQRARMSDAERVLVALLVRVGARTESLEAEGTLRP